MSIPVGKQLYDVDYELELAKTNTRCKTCNTKLEVFEIINVNIINTGTNKPISNNCPRGRMIIKIINDELKHKMKNRSRILLQKC